MNHVYVVLDAATGERVGRETYQDIGEAWDAAGRLSPSAVVAIEREEAYVYC